MSPIANISKLGGVILVYFQMSKIKNLVKKKLAASMDLIKHGTSYDYMAF